jgi:hypothetical protein
MYQDLAINMELESKSKGIKLNAVQLFGARGSYGRPRSELLSQTATQVGTTVDARFAVALQQRLHLPASLASGLQVRLSPCKLQAPH